MKDSEFFDWVRSNQESGQLTQNQVDGAKRVLNVVKPDELQVFVAALTGWKVGGSAAGDKVDTLDRIMSQKGIEQLKDMKACDLVPIKILARCGLSGMVTRQLLVALKFMKG